MDSELQSGSHLGNFSPSASSYLLPSPSPLSSSVYPLPHPFHFSSPPLSIPSLCSLPLKTIQLAGHGGLLPSKAQISAAMTGKYRLSMKRHKLKLGFPLSKMSKSSPSSVAFSCAATGRLCKTQGGKETSVAKMAPIPQPRAQTVASAATYSDQSQAPTVLRE